MQANRADVIKKVAEPIVSRTVIAEQAERALRSLVDTGIMPPNPYYPGSDAAIEFDVTLDRLRSELPDGAEGSA